MATQQLKDVVVVNTYGETSEIMSLARRIKVMIPGGSKLSDAEAQALAQVSLVTKCNPFIGEIWYIPGKGPMIGIKGARRHGNEQIEEAGGKTAYWFPDLKVCSGEEAGYKGDIKDLASAWKCIITDSVTTMQYQKMMMETISLLRDSGSTDPIKDAKEIVGKKPEWVGYGFSTVSESTRMSKQAAAMKRAESDALKKKFYIPFGTDISDVDTASEASNTGWVEASASTPLQVDAEFPESQDINEQESVIELINPTGTEAVEITTRAWNVDAKYAKQELERMKLGKSYNKSEFMELITGDKRAHDKAIKELGF
jgi:hypothetical protein